MSNGPAKKKRTKNQHYAPRLHLQNFVGDAPKNMVWTYDGNWDRPRPSTIANTGAETNFYSVKLQDGTYYDGLDDWLQTVEDAAAAPYRLLLNGEIPTGQDRLDFSTFVSAFYVRSPSLIRAHAEGYAQFIDIEMDLRFSSRERFDAFMDKFEADRGSTVDRDKLFEFGRDKSRYWLEISQKRGLSAMRVADKITPLLYEREWYLIRPDADYFITCDSPVVRYTEPEHSLPGRGDGGFGNPLCEITLPLSPQLMLLITGQPLPKTLFSIPAEGVWEMNAGRALHAERRLYAHACDDRVQELAVQYKDDRLRFHVGMGGQRAEVKVTR